MLGLNKLKQCVRCCFITASFLALTACGQVASEQEMLQKAKNHMNKGELKAASIELRNTLQKNSSNAEARYLLGSINLETGDLTSAEKEFRQAVLAGWSQEETQVNIARILLNRKKLQKLLDEITIIDTWSAETQANISALRALANAELDQKPQAKMELYKARSHFADALHVLRVTSILQLSGTLDGDASITLKKALSIYPNNAELLLLQASYSEQNKDFAQATNTLREIIDLDSGSLITANSRRAHISLARILIIEKKYNAANTALTRLLKQNNKDPEANYLAGLTAYREKNYNRAENHLRKLLAVLPNHSQSQQLMGKVNYELNNFDQAAHHLSTYLNKEPGDITVRKLLANTYILLNQPELARLTLRRILTDNPNDANILLLQSRIEFNEGNTDAGIQSLIKAIESNPKNIVLRQQLAKAYTTNGETELALSEIKIFQELSKNTKETQKLTISAYLKAGEINKAISVANNMLKDQPNDPDTLALIGNLHASNNNRQQALLYFNKALQLQDKLPAATLGLADLEKNEGNLDRATTLYRDLVASNTGGTIPMLALAELAEQQNHTNDMLSWLEKARNITPAETKPRIILASYYLHNKQPKKAEVYIKEAIKISPEHTGLLALYGKILIAKEHYGEAIPQLKKLVSKVPDSIDARILLCKAYLHQRMLNNAREHLQIILTKQDSHAPALGLLAETELKAGNFNKSYEYAKRLQKAHPQFYIGYLQEGNVWLAKHDYNRAHTTFSRAWNLQQTADLAKKLFTTSKRSTNLKADLTPVLTWLETHPDDTPTHLFLATEYHSKEENDNAIKVYEIIIKQTPDNATVLNNLAWLYFLKDNPNALDFAERAYRLTQSNPGILDTYGWILVQRGQVVKGLRLIEQSMKQIPESLEVRYHHAVALIKSGNTIEGRQALEKLLGENKPFLGIEDAKQLIE